MQKDCKVLICWFVVSIAIAHIASAEIEPLTTAGKVVDDQGRPVEGAEIMIVPGRDNVGLSDSQGQFEMTWNPRSRQDDDTGYCVVARHRERNLGLTLPIDGDVGSLKLALRPGVSLSGRVFGADDNAIAGARLSLSIRLPPSSRRSTIDSQSGTDGSGTFKIGGIPAENRYELTVRADGYGEAEIDIDGQDAVHGCLDLGRIELALANMSVTGRVVDINGHPVPGVEVFCFGEGQPSCNTKSDEKGHFELSSVCAGLVRFMAEGRVLNKRVSRQVVTEAGARDVEVVVREGGYSRSYYVRTKSHENIVNSGNPFIAGRVFDEDGLAVADVCVNVRCMQSKNEEGQDTESYFHVTRFGDVTDKQGRFAIALQEEARYSLLFSPDNHAAIIAYDVVTGTRDLKVILPSGGTLTGQLARFSRGKRVPVPDAKLELKQTSRLSYSHIGYDRDRKTMTDSEGRFSFEHIRTLMRTDRQGPVFGPRIWELSHDDTSQTVMFQPGETVKHIDLVIRPKIADAASLTGKNLPDYTGINVDFSQDCFGDNKLLICFFDYEQRPARHCILQLNNRLGQLQKQGLEIIAVQASKTGESELAQWARKMNISFTVGAITGDIDETRFDWNVQSLPWLILTDRKHIVRAEGFAVSELNERLEQIHGD
jgi:protocatechuate 3,4-dioxygenase beta subunit